MTARIDEAIVLAGGLGTRLRTVVQDLPKPLAPVAGRPFLAWVLDRLASAGIRRTILATGYGAATIRDTVGDAWQGMDIVHSVETQALGTGGAVALAARALQGDGVHVLNGDTWLAYDPHALEAAMRAAGTRAAIALAHVDDAGRYGAVDVDGGRVVAFREKSGQGGGAINAGCYCLSRAALAAFPERDAFSLERDVLPGLAAAGELVAFDDTRDFIDIGVPEDYARAQSWFART